MLLVALPTWLADLPVIFGTIGASVGAAWYGFKKYSKRKDVLSEDVVRAVQAQTQIYANLQRIVQSTSAGRVILLKAHNGGNVISAVGTQIYLTIFAEVAPADIKSTQQDFQARAVYDHRYLALLRQVAAAKSVQIWADKMDEDEMLRGVYENAGIHTSLILEVLAAPGAYWYLSVSWSEDAEIDPATKAEIAARADAIGRLLKKDLFR